MEILIIVLIMTIVSTILFINTDKTNNFEKFSDVSTDISKQMMDNYTKNFSEYLGNKFSECFSLLENKESPSYLCKELQISHENYHLDNNCFGCNQNNFIKIEEKTESGKFIYKCSYCGRETHE